MPIYLGLLISLCTEYNVQLLRTPLMQPETLPLCQLPILMPVPPRMRRLLFLVFLGGNNHAVEILLPSMGASLCSKIEKAKSPRDQVVFWCKTEG